MTQCAAQPQKFRRPAGGAGWARCCSPLGRVRSLCGCLGGSLVRLQFCRRFSSCHPAPIADGQAAAGVAGARQGGLGLGRLRPHSGRHQPPAAAKWAPWWIYLIVILGANYLRHALMPSDACLNGPLSWSSWRFPARCSPPLPPSTASSIGPRHRHSAARKQCRIAGCRVPVEQSPGSKAS